MEVRGALAVLAALAVGVAGGYAAGATRGDGDGMPEPVAASASVEPVPATPSVPVDVIAPDPDDPPVASALDLREVELTAPARPDEPDAPSTVLVVSVPDGWQHEFDGAGKHTFTDPAAGDNTYVLVVEFLDDPDVASALRRRTAELDSAEAQGNMRDLEVEINRTDDGFESSFIDTGGYRRVAIERFYPGPDGRALVTVRGSGRQVDSRGLEDLVSRITSAYEVVQGP